MSEMPFKLVLTDIDGTILPFGEKRISPRCAHAMKACLDAGIHIGPASGRGMIEASMPFEGYEELCATALVTNGMEIYIDNKKIYEATIDPDLFARLSAFVARYEDQGMGLIVFEGFNIHILHGTKEGLKESWPIYEQRSHYLSELPTFPVIKANVFGPVDMKFTRFAFDEIRREIPELDYSIPVAGFLNITPKGWNKGTAIDIMCEHLGISLNEVVCFGDAGNDVEMLEHVPHSVAVANATDNAKAAATYVIGSVDDEAVPEAMERIARGENPFV